MEAITAEPETLQSEYGITRVHARRHKEHYEWCWHIVLSRQEQRVIRSFYDMDYTSPEEARDCARAYRDAFLATFPPVTNLQKAQKIRSSNKSGIPGVYRTEDKNTGRAYWRGSVSIDGRERARHFAVSKYGEDRAKAMAIAERQRLLRLFVPHFCRVNPEMQETTGKLFPDHLVAIPEPKSGKWMDDSEFREKLAEIDAKFGPAQTRPRRLYVHATLTHRGKVLKVYVSDWQQKTNYLRGFSTIGSLEGAIGRAKAFIGESITAIHGKERMEDFMAHYGERLEPEAFTATGRFQVKLLESRDAQTGQLSWVPLITEEDGTARR